VRNTKGVYRYQFPSQEESREEVQPYQKEVLVENVEGRVYAVSGGQLLVVSSNSILEVGVHFNLGDVHL